MKNLLIRPDSNLKNALNQMSRTGEKCLVVVNKKNKLKNFIFALILKATKLKYYGKGKF